MAPVAQDPASPWLCSVLTISDRHARGERPDESGDAIAERLLTLPGTIGERRIVPDASDRIAGAVAAMAVECDLLVTTGGTGLAPRDVTPDAMRPLLDREIPGMGEAMRAVGIVHSPQAMLSRQLAGTRGKCLVLVLAGSIDSVTECLDAVWGALPHALYIVSGRAIDHPVPTG